MKGRVGMIETPVEFHLRSKVELLRSIIDGMELENAAADYLFSKTNIARHGMFTNNHAEISLTYLSSDILKKSRKWSRSSFRDIISEQEGEAASPWIPRLNRHAKGHDNPRAAHTSWPRIVDRDPTMPYGSLSPWDMSPLMDGQEFGNPTWMGILDTAYSPFLDKDGNITNHTKHYLEPGVHAHEKDHQGSWAQEPAHMGSGDGKGHNGGAPSEMYENHFRRWVGEAATKEQRGMDEMKQRQQHIKTYKDVWAGKERDPLDPYDKGDHSLGMLGYAFGLEWMTPTQRDDVIRHLSDYGLMGHDDDAWSGIDDADQGDGRKMPHIPQPWLTRNWMGRFVESAIHQSRGMDSVGSILPAPHYDMHDVDIKENFKKRHLIEAMKDVLVYEHDAGDADMLRPGTNSGDLAYGYFDENRDSRTYGQWVHDEDSDKSGHAYDLGSRKTTDTRYLGGGRKNQAGVISLMDWVANQDKDGRIPRRDQNGKLGTNHRTNNDEHFGTTEEFDDYLDSGILDENQHSHVKNRAAEVSEEFDRRTQVLNHLAPYTSMYYFRGGNSNDITTSPYQLYKGPFHTRGGHNLDVNNTQSELNHMYGPDKDEGDGWHQHSGLFTRPPRAGQQFYGMSLREGARPEDFPKDIWPVGTDTSGLQGEGLGGMETRQESEQITTPLGNEPREDMHGLLGILADQPLESWDYGGIANLQSGANDHWTQLLTTHEPHHVQEKSRVGETGAIRLGVDGIMADANTLGRRASHHVLSKGGRGREREKYRALMNSLLFKWNEHPSQSPLTTGALSALHDKGAITSGGASEKVSRWTTALRAMGIADPHLIPGNPHENDLQERINQFLMQTGIDLQPSGGRYGREQPLPIVKPRREEHEAAYGTNIYQTGRVPGVEPSTESTEEFGWLPESRPPGKWGLHSKVPTLTDDNEWSTHIIQSGPREGEKALDPHRQHGEPVNWGAKDGIQPHGFDFDFEMDALSAQNDGEVKCPVCNGDGHIDPEDITRKAEGPPSLFGGDEGPPDLFSSEAVEMKVGEMCPNCHGTGKHKLTQEALDANIAPLHPSHHKEVLLTNRIEDLTRQAHEAMDKGLSGAEYQGEIERLEDQLEYGIRTPVSEGDQTRTRQGTQQESWKYHMQKVSSTADLVRDYATHLAQTVRDQFTKDKLDDPFGPDENGDWSQAHVNALQLWRYANEWALRGQPGALPDELKDSSMYGYRIGVDGHKEVLLTNRIEDLTRQAHEAMDKGLSGAEYQGEIERLEDQLDAGRDGTVSAGAAMYYGDTNDTSRFQNEMKSVPMSVFNSDGYRLHFGWKMTPTWMAQFDGMGKPMVKHNDGDVSTERIPLLNVPFEDIQGVFPEMEGGMSDTHPSAPGANDIPESQKTDEYGQSNVFKLSEDAHVISDLVKSLTNPDLTKEDGQFIPIKAAHRIFALKDLKNLRGLSGDWVVSCWWKGRRAIVRKDDDSLTAKYADGTDCKLSKDDKKGLLESNDDDFVLDVNVAKNKYIDVIDLLEHDGKELYNKPLKHRIRLLRSVFDSTDTVRFPAPFNTRRTDDEGLEQAIANLAEEESDGYLLRDADSTYMKGEPRHPKWVLLRKSKEIDVIILDRRGRGPYTYRLGIGPINPDKAKSLGNRATERDGNWFMDIGSLVRERKAFNEGDYVQVRISSVSHRRRKGEDVYTVQPTRIIGTSETSATNSVDTLSLLVKSHNPMILPHDVDIASNEVRVNLHGLNDTVIYKVNQWDDGWAIHEPFSVLGDLSGDDYTIHVAESLRPFWEPVVAITLKGVVKPTKDEKDEDVGIHEEGFEVKKPKRLDDEQILKPEISKTILIALQMVDDMFAKKATWTGPKGLGIGLGTPDSAPRGPTELTADQNTLDYDMRPRPEDEVLAERPKKGGKKPQGKAKKVTISLTTDEKEKGKIRVTEEDAVLEIQPE